MWVLIVNDDFGHRYKVVGPFESLTAAVECGDRFPASFERQYELLEDPSTALEDL